MTTQTIDSKPAEAAVPSANWKSYELFLFRVAFVFFTVLSIPLSLRYYSTLFSLNWFDLGYRDITNMGRFSPNLISINSESGRWGWASYADYAVILGGAIVVALLWSVFDRKRKNYNLLYYWLRVIVRYRVAIGMIEFGFVKVFLIQMPEAPLGTLHTRFGDITAQKLYWLSIGVVPWYEIVLGLVEVIAGTLLFFRKTVMPGALLTVAASANIVFVNFAYDGGVHVYSTYFVILGLFLLIPYIPEYYRLLVKQEEVVPVRYYPAFTGLFVKISRYVLKGGIIFLFLPVLSYLHVQNWKHEPFVKQPITPGIPGTTGYYTVTEFRLNNEILPYSPLDSVRWQDVTFEKHSTITFKVNKPVRLDLSNGVPQRKDVDRTWELTGIAGGRQFYYYDADTIKKVIKLYNKHSDGDRGNRRRGAGAPGVEREKKPDYVFTYNGVGSPEIILEGHNKRGDRIAVTLNRVQKTYALRTR